MNKKKVLFVDDDAGMLSLLSIWACDKKNLVDVVTWMDPTTVDEKLDLPTFDMILIDQMMYKITGLELIKKIQDKVKCPIYILTGYDRQYVREEIKRCNLNVVDVISKDEFVPEKMDELIS